jgi:ABC-type polysaccharide/polyol phosphate export permease
MVPFMIMMLFFGLQIGWETLLFFPVLLLFSCFTFGISLILSSFNVYFRDMQLAWTSFMPAIFYATPIAYTSNLIPEKFLWLIKLNPLYHFVGAFRDFLYYNQSPSFTQFGILLLLGIVPLLAGLYIFNKLEKGFVSQY